MRPIKFRCWVVAETEFDELCSIEPHMATQGEPDIDTLDRFMNLYGGCKNLMQFTGLLDKNGKEIFEGDIIKTSYGGVFEIKFGQTEDVCIMAFYAENANKELQVEIGGDNFKSNINSYIEIIGNIYSNPELLTP